MGLQKRNPFKTFVLSKNTLAVFVYVTVSIISLFFLIVVMSFFPSEKITEVIMDTFLKGKTVYSEIFTDEKGRINAIMEGYTMVIGIKKVPEKGENTPTPAPVREEKPKITERTVTSLAEIKNQTSKIFDASALALQPLQFQASGDKPKVLIIHTHTTESYFEQDRSVDETKNMLSIGNVIKESLEAAGIDVIHDKTVHDYPTYNGSYTRSAATTSKNLSSNSGINIVLDVHRDAIATDDGSKLSLLTDINGVKTAQLMFVVGTDAQLSHPNWQENLKLALKLQNKAGEMYNGLMRPINLREQRFNQQLSKGSIILEVGTNGNTLEEAKQGAKLFSNVLINVLTNNN